MTQIVKISKAGYNVLTETDPDNLIFSSDYPTLKYSTSGSVALNWSKNQGGAAGQHIFTSTIAHGLGYEPFVLAYINNDAYFGGTGIYLPLPYHTSTLARVQDFQHYTDATNLVFEITDDQAFTGTQVSYTAIIKYFIFRNDVDIL